MPKMPAVKPREMIKFILALGFVLERQKGSHMIFTNINMTVVVPFHNKELKQKTLKHIIQQSGLSVEIFVKLFTK
jgi:predicted RNA binding protein YcfA (HicA-like mRNA interferase family)